MTEYKKLSSDDVLSIVGLVIIIIIIVRGGHNGPDNDHLTISWSYLMRSPITFVGKLKKKTCFTNSWKENKMMAMMMMIIIIIIIII